MSGWYGHTIHVDITNNIKFPKFGGKLGMLDDILSSESDNLERKMNYIGSQIAYNIAISSQTLQRKAITELDAVDTGRLRESIRITGSGLTSYVGTDLFYAEQVHDEGFKGTGNINVKWPNGVGPRPWTDISSDILFRDVDDIVSGLINRNF